MLWLSGWFYRKNHVINPAAGAGAGYQVRVTVHYGVGTDSGIDVYCTSLCRTDFGDIRFTDDSNNPLDYWMQSKTDEDNAVFWVKIAGSLEATSQTVYVYYGKSDASTTSNQAATFVDVISGVVGAWNMEEANASDPVHDYSGNSNNGTASGTTVTTSPFFAGKNIRQLNGSTDYIATSNGNSVKNRAKVTLELRFKATTLDSNQRCLYREVLNGSTSARFDLTIDTTKKLLFRGRAPDTDALTTWVSSNTVLAANTLYHVVAVFDSVTGNHYLYINGNQESATVSDVAFDNTNPNSTPRFGYTPTFILPIAGVVGNANLYADALSASQVSNLKNNYPDVTLEAGKVFVRKWATSSQPSHDVWGGLERLVVASDSFSATDGVLRDKLLGVSDSVGVADALFGCKALLLSDSVGAVDGLAALKTLLVDDVVGLSDLFLALKGVGVADSLVLLDWVSVPLRVRSVLDSVCLADGLTVNKVLRIAEDVFVAETVEVGSGDRRTRLFLILGNVAVQLTKNA